MIYTSDYDSPVGKILLAGRGGKLCGLWINGQTPCLEKYNEGIQSSDSEEIIISAKKWLDKYFGGQKPCINELDTELPCYISEFRRLVLQLLCDIPYGRVTTYKIIAEKAAALMGKEKMSAQAVGGAVGHNPISIIIPCHRVVGSDGSMTGYGGGTDIKIKLLEHEKADMGSFYIPEK